MPETKLMSYVDFASTLIKLGITTFEALEAIWKEDVSPDDLADIRAEVNRRIARRGGLPANDSPDGSAAV